MVKNYKISYLIKRISLAEGDQFGELALLNSKPRMATVIASERTVWAVLDKEPFIKILQKHEKNKQEALINVIDSFTFFK